MLNFFKLNYKRFSIFLQITYICSQALFSLLTECRSSKYVERINKIDLMKFRHLTTLGKVKAIELIKF